MTSPVNHNSNPDTKSLLKKSGSEFHEELAALWSKANSVGTTKLKSPPAVASKIIESCQFEEELIAIRLPNGKQVQYHEKLKVIILPSGKMVQILSPDKKLEVKEMETPINSDDELKESDEELEIVLDPNIKTKLEALTRSNRELQSSSNSDRKTILELPDLTD